MAVQERRPLWGQATIQVYKKTPIILLKKLVCLLTSALSVCVISFFPVYLHTYLPGTICECVFTYQIRNRHLFSFVTLSTTFICDNIPLVWFTCQITSTNVHIWLADHILAVIEINFVRRCESDVLPWFNNRACGKNWEVWELDNRVNTHEIWINSYI